MNAMRVLKLSMPLLAFGVALVFTPACRAQSEVAPDHFDVADAGAAAATAKVPAAKAKRSSQVALSKAPQKGAAAAPATQVTAASNSSTAQHSELVAVQDKRKTLAASNKPKQ